VLVWILDDAAAVKRASGISATPAARKHPRGADDARLSPRHAFCAGDPDSEAVLKRASQLLGRTAVVETVGGKCRFQRVPAVSDA
jgi:hypothetical protein